MEKDLIVATLGETGLVRPALVNAALGANDRAKYYFTLLQAARAHAEGGDTAAPTLRRERELAQVADESLDAVIPGSARDGGDAYLVPHAGAILEALFNEVGAMLLPLRDDDRTRAQSRMSLLRSQVGTSEPNRITGEVIDALTATDRNRADSLHLLVMDVHKELNALQVAMASEVVDGAHAYAIEPQDRALIAAFMQGLHRTSPLKFDHPGLGTTATRDGARLVIQNDIGTTDAHVLVTHVQGLTCAVTYTDVHLQRLLFFQGLFDGEAVDWQDVRSRRDDATAAGLYHLTTGSYRAADAADLERYLAVLGSRLVFLIDWNKARKRLRMLLPKPAALALLAWAARAEVGHMAFLIAGGETLVFEALELAARSRIHYGKLLTEILGEKEAVEYMRFVLRTCTQAAIAREPLAFVQDAIRAELVNHLRTGEERLFEVASDHAGYATEIATAVHEAVLAASRGDLHAVFERTSERAKRWETQADELVSEARRAAETDDSARFFADLMARADDIVDALEDAAFHLSAVPAINAASLPDPLANLAGTVLTGAHEYVRLIEIARDVHRHGPGDDLQDLLASIHRIRELEHQADEHQRSVKRALLASDASAGALHAMMTVVRNMEEASDELMHCALDVRDRVLGDVARR